MYNNVKVLVVEDSITQAHQLKFILEKNNYIVKISTDGIEALNVIDDFLPDLIISDIIMPRMDGYKLCQTIKGSGKWNHIPVILLTSLSESMDVIEGLKVKADNFITKPYNDNFLLSRIRHILINIEMRKNKISEMGMEVFFAGEKHFINSERIQIIDLLLSTFDNAVQKTKELENANKKLKMAYDRIRKLEKNYRGILENSKDALVVINKCREILYINPETKNLFKHTHNEYILDIFKENEIEPGIKEIEIRYNNTFMIAEMIISETNWEGKDVFLVSLRDITERVKLREQLKMQSCTDDLTLLYNRRGFYSVSEYKIQSAKRNKKGMALFFIDIDNMKIINDTLSHVEGDSAIVAVADILKRTFRTKDVIGRIGGDEFVVLCMDMKEENIKLLEDRLIQKQKEFNLESKYRFTLSVSVGAVYFEAEENISIEELVNKADKLMYEHKKSKKVLY